ncbi:plasmid mobilization relaxosome protein MobC [Helicobacter apodemus]|uniref:Plasmid mobilization relaxosome protein MobC n=1 Tax=Helicobacter apodemus TaxID=135569 RepID=A0A4U8UIR4_9HELI|nr:plasmid mobilization relaxosome protein MobC [Helicobacter apodemus]TLE15939.1 plasmid mobilization relaxosome protein MobC [Helicobacter apodemus]
MGEKIKSTRVGFYLNEDDQRMLQSLKNRKGITKNAIIREMIKECYFREDDSKESKNIAYLIMLNKTFIDNIHRIGNNINQIAYHLNAGKELNNQIESIIGNINEIKNILTEYKKILKKDRIHNLFKKSKYRRVSKNG